MPKPDLLTTGDIAKILNRPAAQVRHVLNSRRWIHPLVQVGGYRLYQRAVLRELRAELRKVDARSRRKVPVG